MSDHETPRPGERSGDETFDRLRAADPVAAADIDLTAVRRALDTRVVTVTGAGEGSADGSDTDAEPRAEDSGVTPLRATPAAPGRWLRIAAVAATVALVGSAAFVVGRQSSAGTTSTAGSAVAASAEGATGAVAIDSAPVASVPGASPTRLPGVGGAAGSETLSATDQKLIAGGYGRTHFNDGGLANDGGSAEAWGFDPAAVISAATAERVAAAMGLAGAATVQYQTWVVGSSDGSGPAVSLSGDGIASISYNDPTAYPTCTTDGSAPDGISTDGITTDSVVTDPCAATPVDITGGEAIARATDVLTRIGVDPAGYRLTSPDDQVGTGFRSVIGAQLLNGAETGVQFSFGFVGDRLASFYGGLAPAVSLGQYAVISPAAAVERMNDPRFGATSQSYPIDIMRTDVATPEVPTDQVPTPAAPTPGASIGWPVAEVTLTSATLGLSSQYQADGRTLLVPTYTMTDADGSTWSVIAVADDQLDFTG